MAKIIRTNKPVETLDVSQLDIETLHEREPLALQYQTMAVRRAIKRGIDPRRFANPDAPRPDASAAQVARVVQTPAGNEHTVMVTNTNYDGRIDASRVERLGLTEDAIQEALLRTVEATKGFIALQVDPEEKKAGPIITRSAINSVMAYARDRSGMTGIFDKKGSIIATSPTTLDNDALLETLSAPDTTEIVDSKDRIAWIISLMTDKQRDALAKKMRGETLTKTEHKRIYDMREHIQAALDAEAAREVADQRHPLLDHAFESLYLEGSKAIATGERIDSTYDLNNLEDVPELGEPFSAQVERAIDRAHEAGTPVRLGRNIGRKTPRVYQNASGRPDIVELMDNQKTLYGRFLKPLKA